MRTIPVLPLPTPRLVMFDVDYTLLRPSDQFEAAGYVRTGKTFGLDLDARRWPAAERAAYAAVRERRRHTGDAHDEGLLEVIAHAVIGGLGGGDPAAVDAAAQAIIAAWSRMEHFGLYDDVRPCLACLRGAGLSIALVSNAVGHALAEVIAHFALDDVVDAAVASADVGATKPAPQVFLAALAEAGAEAAETVMVGDSLEDDVEGALACGCGAILLDRLGRHRQSPVPRISSLVELPAALGLPAH